MVFKKRYKARRESKPRGSFNGKHGDKAFRAIKEFRNKRDVWTITNEPFKEAHFATFPPKLIEPCILAGCPKDGIVLDPFMGSGTTAMKALELQRNFIGFELNSEYIEIARKHRISDVQIKMI